MQRPVIRYLLFLCGVFVLLRSMSLAHAQQQQPVVIRFRYWGDFKEIQALQATIDAFERDHPGVKVHGERVPSGDEYTQKLLIEQAAGLTPDVVFCGAQFAEFAGRGMLLDLKPFLAKDPSVDLDAYYPQLVQLFTKGDALYALPRDIAPMGLVYYNKALFDRAKLPYPDGSWSWDYVPHPERGDKDFLTVAQKLTKLDKSGSQKSIFGYSAGSSAWTAENFVFSSGAELVDNFAAPKKILYDDPRVIRALQLAQDLQYKYNVSPDATFVQSSGVSTHDLFAQGRVAMYVTGIWEVPRFREEIGDRFDWDIAAFPMGPTGKRGVKVGWSGYAITSATKHPQESWEFLKYLSGKVGLGLLAKTGLAQPALADLANSPVWLDGQRPKNRKLTIEQVPYVHFDVLYPNWKEVEAIINPKLELVWNGTMTANQAVKTFLPPAQKKLDALNNPPRYPKLNWGAGVAGMSFVAAGLVFWVYLGARQDRKYIGTGFRARAESRAGFWFISPWLIGVVLFLLGPMLVSLLLAFSSWDIIGPASWVGTANFREMAADERFTSSLRATFIYTIFSVPLGVAGSLGLALLLNTKIRGQALFRTLYYLPAVASAVAASLIWLRLFNPDSGLLNYIINALHLNGLMSALHLTESGKDYVNWLGSEKTALGSLIIMSLWGIGGGMVIYLAGLQGIPQSYYEAAAIDGASTWQKFRHVTLPLLTPTIFFTLIMGFIGSFQVFTQGFIMTGGGPNNATLFYVLYLYQNAFQFLKLGYASAMAWVLFVIILAFTLVQLKLSGWVHYEGESK